MVRLALVLMVMWSMLSTWSMWSCCEASRSKRLMNGIPIEQADRGAYDVVNYTVWIGLARNPFQRLEIFGWKAERQECGGALLTPRIVQSACHCFADYIRREENGLRRALRNDKTFELVAGYTRVVRVGELVSIEHYVIHPLCALHAQGAGVVIFDMALVVPSKDILLLPFITNAPVYLLKDVAAMWERMIRNRLVCLVVGWGKYLTRFERNSPKSPVLRHGWNILPSFVDCYKDISTGLDLDATRFLEEISKSCLRHFGHLPVYIAKGDSGSPVTCNNVYVGIASAAKDVEGGWSYMDDLVYYPFANSLEYRKRLISAMAESNPEEHNEHNPIRLYDRILTGTPPKNFIGFISNSACKIRAPDLIITYGMFHPNLYMRNKHMAI